MPTLKEFSIHLEDKPGTLGKVCRALADQNVNIVAFQSFPEEKGKSAVRLVTDDPAMTKKVLESERVSHTETQVAQTRLPHQPGALANAAATLGEGNININYAYAGSEPRTNVPIVIFGVEEVDEAAKILDEVAAKAA